MRYAMIMAGGSGTRLWPMSRAERPKQLIPFMQGRSLLQIAWDRLEGVVPVERRYICAGLKHRDAIVEAVPGCDSARFLGEPTGRDTLNAVGFAAAVIGRQDPDAVIAVFTADHLIEPVDKFREIVANGFELAERRPNALVTFGIKPTHAATGYGYLELGDPVADDAEASDGGPRVVDQFKEKPQEPTAQQYFAAGPEKYLWNSGMFVWRAATLVDCIRRYEPDVHTGLARIADHWGAPDRDGVLNEVYPGLKKISVDFAVMEPASKDPQVTVAAVPMPLDWKDVGSWPAFADTLPADEHGNRTGGGQHLLHHARNTFAASSDPNHLIAAVGCEDLLIVHTPDATLVCRADDAEAIKQVHAEVKERFGEERV